MSNKFALSETEYKNLESVRGQLNLVSDLLCASGADSSLFAAADLLEFLSKQVESLRGVIRAVDARYELQQNTQPVNYTHWMYALRIAAGDALHTPMGAENRVTEALRTAARIDDDMSQALGVWLDVLGREGSVPAAPAPAKKSAPRKRDKLGSKLMEVA